MLNATLIVLAVMVSAFFLVASITLASMLLDIRRKRRLVTEAKQAIARADIIIRAAKRERAERRACQSPNIWDNEHRD